MPVYFNRFRAGQRVNIPRHIGRQRMPMVRNTTIFLGGYQGGHHCCCGGGVSGFGRFLAGCTAFMGVFGSFFGGIFGGGKRQVNPFEVQAQYTDGRRTGYYTPGDYSSGERAGQDTPVNTNNEEITELKKEIAELTNTVKDLSAKLENANNRDGLGGLNTGADTQKDLKTNYTNEHNINTGFSYSNDKVTITDKNVPEIVTLSAFILNDNDLSTISLKKKDWENDFNLIAGANSTMTEMQFTNWFENYTKNAEADAKIENHDQASQRRRTDTVNISASDKEFIKQLYKAMSNNGKTLSATQFKTFMEGFFNNDTNYSSDDSFSRKEFAEYVQKKLYAQKPSDSED